MDKKRKELGQMLSEARKKAGISKYKILKDENVGLGVIDSIENGTKAYTIDSLLKYCSVIGVNLTIKY